MELCSSPGQPDSGLPRRGVGYRSVEPTGFSDAGWQGVRGKDVTSRRGFLKIAAAGAAGSALTPAFGRAAGKTVTLLHESSFIPPFDEYMKNVLAPAYEKET